MRFVKCVKLQQHFNEVIFNLEQEMYLEEGIPLSEVLSPPHYVYPYWCMYVCMWFYLHNLFSNSQVAFEDNSACVMLIEGRMGLISLLDDECSLGPKGSDITYINKVHWATFDRSIIDTHYS